MPQARAELANKFNDDFHAWKVLERHGWTNKSGMLETPFKKRITDEEWDAVDYLIEEWDWALAPPRYEDMPNHQN